VLWRGTDGTAADPANGEAHGDSECIAWWNEDGLDALERQISQWFP